MDGHIEGLAVERRDAMFGDGALVFWSRITLVLLPIVNGKLRVILLHHQIPCGFGQNGGRRNLLILGVATNNTNMLDVAIRLEPVAVNQEHFWLNF